MDLSHETRRAPVLARNVVATSQPLAVEAAIQAMRRGGNAVDAALTAAITLTVVEPTSNGIGSDAFALVWDGARLHGLNGSGRAPGGWKPERFADRSEMPDLGWNSVTVPGAVDAWRTLSARFGKLPFEQLFEPAIRYATDGFLVAPITAHHWAGAVARYRELPVFGEAFLPDGRAPRAGERFVCPGQAASLESIAGTAGDSFYKGELAERIVADAVANGGAMAADDLAAHRSDWVEPIDTGYRGVRLHETPPNGQGLAALIALGILDRFDLAACPADSAASVHLQVEAMKIGFAEADRHVADPDALEVAPAVFLDDAFLDECSAQVDPERASFPVSRAPLAHGTVYLTTADENGWMVSFIQSNFAGFGSGVVIPGTGISLQNRGVGFTLEPGHPNRVAGGKRPFHTIIPAFVTRGGAAEMSFGVMGGPMQPQGHVQMMVRIFDHGQDPQTASDAPRWFVDREGTVSLEAGFPSETAEGLGLRGHAIEAPEFGRFGGAQLIRRIEGGYLAASDFRKDGMAAGYG